MNFVHGTAILTALGAIVAGCCGSSSGEDTTRSSGESIMDGQITCERPEVGVTSNSGNECTGTLITPQVVLTAAHCVEGGLYAVSRPGFDLGWFVPNAGCPGAKNLDGIERFSRLIVVQGEFSSAENDVALLRLEDPADPSIHPARVAWAKPDNGTLTTWYGYGQRDFGNCLAAIVNGDVNDDKKSVVRGLTYPVSSMRTCPGDSGGPLFDEHGEIINLVHSKGAWVEPLAHRDWIMAQTAAWSKSTDMTCGDWSEGAGYGAARCDSAEGSACGGRGVPTSDCGRCCDVAPTAASASAMTCGAYGRANGLRHLACEVNGNGACGGAGPATSECDHCCDLGR